MLLSEPRAPSRKRAAELVVDQACRLPEVRGAVILAADDEDAGALRIVAAGGDHARHRGRRVQADTLDARLAVSARAPIPGRPGATLAVTLTGDSGDADFPLEDLAALAALGSGDGPDLMEMVAAGVGALAKLLALRDGYTGDHADEVVELCETLAVRLRLDAAAAAELSMAARLHDLGKIGVPDVILHKPGRLTAAEWDVMRKHPGWGAEALDVVPGAAGVAAAVRGHHERWDGNGYPDGLAGQDIPMASRIIAVADAWHAMTSNRSYRRALDDDHARAELRNGAGRQFDPAVVAALLAVLEDRHGRFTRERAAPAPAAAALADGGGDRRGRARELAAALTRVTRLPALRESQERLATLLAAPASAGRDLLEVLEADLALTVAVIRAANALSGVRRITTVPDALEVLGRDRLGDVVADVRSIDYFQQVIGWKEPPEHVRLHALATQRAASLIARSLDLGRTEHDTLMVGALLHDVGKLVLETITPAYPKGIHGDARTPDARVLAERRALGFDHALTGGLLLRRWVLPEALAVMVENHHSEHAEGPAAILRLADQLAHYAHARPVDPPILLRAGQAAGLSPQQLRAVMFDLSKAGGDSAPRALEPSPLTRSQQHVLRGLAEGRTYKEIATDLNLSASTVRSHLHAVYQRFGVSDRSQAVLHATARGWI